MKLVLSISTYIDNMLKMACRHDISADVVSEIPRRGDFWGERGQNYKYTILNNGAYYVYHDCDKNQKVSEYMKVPCPLYS